MLQNPSISTYSESWDENSELSKIDPKIIAKYIDLFGEKNRKSVMDLLNTYPNKLDIDPRTYIQPKIEKLKSTWLKVKSILDLCITNIRVLSSRENKYWRKVNILIEEWIPSNLLYDMLIFNSSKKELKEVIKGMLVIKSKSH